MLCPANIAISLFENRLKKLLFILEVIVNQTLVEASAFCDSIHATAPKPVFGKLLSCGVKNGMLRAFGIALAIFGVCFQFKTDKSLFGELECASLGEMRRLEINCGFKLKPED